VFFLPGLQSVVMSQNCFRGCLPESMCFNDNLRSIVMDLLTGNCYTEGNDIFQGKVLTAQFQHVFGAADLFGRYIYWATGCKALFWILRTRQLYRCLH
jgi:hypothetical protein